jgi:hypothetical protein
VPGVGHLDQLDRSRQYLGHAARVRRRGQLVALAGDHERRHGQRLERVVELDP